MWTFSLIIEWWMHSLQLYWKNQCKCASNLALAILLEMSCDFMKPMWWMWKKSERLFDQIATLTAKLRRAKRLILLFFFDFCFGSNKHECSTNWPHCSTWYGDLLKSLHLNQPYASPWGPWDSSWGIRPAPSRDQEAAIKCILALNTY